MTPKPPQFNFPLPPTQRTKNHQSQTSRIKCKKKKVSIEPGKKMTLFPALEFPPPGVPLFPLPPPPSNNARNVPRRFPNRRMRETKVISDFRIIFATAWRRSRIFTIPDETISKGETCVEKNSLHLRARGLSPTRAQRREKNDWTAPSAHLSESLFFLALSPFIRAKNETQRPKSERPIRTKTHAHQGFLVSSAVARAESAALTADQFLREFARGIGKFASRGENGAKRERRWGKVSISRWKMRGIWGLGFFNSLLSRSGEVRGSPAGRRCGASPNFFYSFKIWNRFRISRFCGLVF